MRRSTLVTALALAGCATSGSGFPTTTAPQQPTRVETDAGTTEIAINATARAQENVVAGSPEALWPALVAAYQNLNIPVTTLDANTKTLGNTNLAVSRKLAGVPLSTWLDCGRTATRTHVADQYVVNLSVATQVQPAAAGSSKVVTLLQGRAKSHFTNDPAVQCSSTGRLEKRIAEEIARMASSAGR